MTHVTNLTARQILLLRHFRQPFRIVKEVSVISMAFQHQLEADQGILKRTATKKLKCCAKMDGTLLDGQIIQGKFLLYYVIYKIVETLARMLSSD